MKNDRPSSFSVIDIVLMIVLVGIVIIVILALLGPTIGNVFSPVIYADCIFREKAYVWLDENGNGIRDEGEEPLAGVTVRSPIGGLTSDSSRVLEFAGLMPCGGKNLEIYAEVPTGYRLTTESRVPAYQGNIQFGFIRVDSTPTPIPG